MFCAPLIGFGQKTGCTDPSKLEYDSHAAVDDGSYAYDTLMFIFQMIVILSILTHQEPKKLQGTQYFNKFVEDQIKKLLMENLQIQ